MRQSVWEDITQNHDCQYGKYLRTAVVFWKITKCGLFWSTLLQLLIDTSIQFYPEADIWHAHMPRTSFGTLFARNISVAGLSPLYPQVHCTSAGEICHMTVGESEINAAASMTGLVLSNDFELTHTYFLTGGIAGVNPKLGTLGTVALAKFSVQVALQYEFDAREMPDNFSTGYLPYGADLPDQYPTISYGTEVMELNEALRDAAVSFASRAKLTDSTTTAEYRAKYQGVGETYTAATKIPAVIKGDSATSDVYYSGSLLSQAFENTTKIWTNQTAMTYCMTAQEDNAVLQALMRGHLAGRVDYSRAIVMRSGMPLPLYRFSVIDDSQDPISTARHQKCLCLNIYESWTRMDSRWPSITSSLPALRL